MLGRLTPAVQACLLACLLAACAAGSATEATPGYVAGQGVQVIPVDQRQPAPAVDAPTLDGGRLALAELDGPVIVNFWASWCGPCAREAPELQAIAERYEGRAHVVGANVKDRPVNALAFERDFGVTYPSWDDRSAAIAASFGGIGPAALPSTVVLDASHRVAVRLAGAVTAAQLQEYLTALLAEA